MATDFVTQGNQELPPLTKSETLGNQSVTEYVSPCKEEQAKQAASLQNEDRPASNMSTTRVALLLGTVWVSHWLHAPLSQY